MTSQGELWHFECVPRQDMEILLPSNISYLCMPDSKAWNIQNTWGAAELSPGTYRVTHRSHCIRFLPISYTGVNGEPIGRPRSADRVVILYTLSIPRWRQFLRGLRLECINPLNPELNPICYLLALLGAHHFIHVSRIRVKLLTFRLLMSYIYIYIWSTHSWCF